VDNGNILTCSGFCQIANHNAILLVFLHQRAHIDLMKTSIITAVCLTCLLALTSQSAQAKKIDLKYRVFVGGLEAGEVTLQINHGEDSYHVISEIRSLGLVDVLIKFRSNSFSKGRVINNIVSPTKHEAHNMWRGDPRSVVMSYNERGPHMVDVAPLPEDDDRLPVKEGMKLATIDALSAALVTSLSAMSESNRCNMSVPIFDGRRRYNVHIKGEEEQAVEGPIYSGDAYRCELKIERIAGHSRSPWMPQRDDESGDIWFARLAPAWTPIPVRFEADIGMGSLVIHLVHASGIGVDKRYYKSQVAKDDSNSD
jgi:hypothetical protein